LLSTPSRTARSAGARANGISFWRICMTGTWLREARCFLRSIRARLAPTTRHSYANSSLRVAQQWSVNGFSSPMGCDNARWWSLKLALSNPLVRHLVHPFPTFGSENGQFVVHELRFADCAPHPGAGRVAPVSPHF